MWDGIRVTINGGKGWFEVCSNTSRLRQTNSTDSVNDCLAFDDDDECGNESDPIPSLVKETDLPHSNRSLGRQSSGSQSRVAKRTHVLYHNWPIRADNIPDKAIFRWKHSCLSACVHVNTCQRTT
ncbi:uncharacterized protein LOC128726877 [Anopheles nili]|uniref:uncharacterized protein LOC128726877 n=1 Tax=Anopheles nili TaxID=185578 RepID=UPI00237B1CA9|nr:uncharacterized protein LOC128726877 [Anopheles nili]